MKEKILQNINAVVMALNRVYVSGKDNLANLSGSITVLEDVYTMLNACEVVEPKTKAKKEEKE